MNKTLITIKDIRIMVTKSKKTVTNAVNKTLETVKNTASKANDFALKSTENVVTETINYAGQWQGITAKAMKGGFKLAATQQDIMFDTLEAAKGHTIKGLKRSKALFTK
jgi:hypothetical protein